MTESHQSETASENTLREGLLARKPPRVGLHNRIRGVGLIPGCTPLIDTQEDGPTAGEKAGEGGGDRGREGWREGKEMERRGGGRNEGGGRARDSERGGEGEGEGEGARAEGIGHGREKKRKGGRERRPPRAA